MNFPWLPSQICHKRSAHTNKNSFSRGSRGQKSKTKVLTWAPGPRGQSGSLQTGCPLGRGSIPPSLSQSSHLVLSLLASSPCPVMTPVIVFRVHTNAAWPPLPYIHQNPVLRESHLLSFHRDMDSGGPGRDLLQPTTRALVHTYTLYLLQ